METPRTQRVTAEVGKGTDKASLAKNITAALMEISEKGSIPDLIKDRPAEFFRDLYEVWYENGGLEGGRPRNSIRRMRQTWLTDDTKVRSLHPKLVGQVKLTKSDAGSLIDLFLSRWEYVGSHRRDETVTTDGYVPFPANDSLKIKRAILKALFLDEDGLLLPDRRHDDDDSEDIDVVKMAQDPAYHDSDAVIILSRHHTILGPTPPETIRLFWHFQNSMYESSNKDSIDKPIFVWVVDMSNRIIEEEFALSEYYNSSFLAIALHSFAMFDSIKDSRDQKHSKLVQRLTIPRNRQRRNRWEWLRSRSAIVVQNLEREEFEGIYGEEEKKLNDIRLKDIGVTSEHILPSSTPHIWSKPLRNLYGTREVNISDVALTIHTNLDGWRNAKSIDSNFRYMAHTELHEYPKKFDPDEFAGLAQSYRSIDLPSPGEIYEEASKLTYLAARFRLRENDKFELDDEAVAMAYLRRQGFQVLKLDEFLRLFWTIPS